MNLSRVSFACFLSKRPYRKAVWCLFVAALACVFLSSSVFAQGVTTAAIFGTVVDNAGNPLPGANVVATHIPSGTIYGSTSRANGEYNLPNLRVGGPYSVTVTYVGYTKQEYRDIYLQVSQSLRQDFRMVEEAVRVPEVQVTGERSAILSAGRTGAATSLTSEAFRLPTITARISDFARLTPEARGGSSYVGQDNRLNNVTVDGAYFNQSFGLAGVLGERTGVAPISLSALEQVQINVAPYDVRQGNFVGASVNMVTRSGTNEFSGSAYYAWRHQGLVGTEAKDSKVDPGTFKFKRRGVNLGGPILTNKLFFFMDYQADDDTRPGTTYKANTGNQTVGGNITRVVADTLNRLSNFLREKFGYETGPYQGYDFKTPARRFIAKLDYSVDERNKLTLRYNHLDSETDVLLSNSSSLGFGTRRTVTTALNFANSNYGILENIRSIVGEWNSIIGPNMANNLIIGYSHHDESRSYRGSWFPFVDILEGGSVYTSFGFEPFTPNNELRYWTYQLQNNFTIYGPKHHLTFGVSAERYQSENVFFPGSQSVYVYNSLADFYRDANDYLANPNRTSSPVALRRFQVRWMNIPGMEKPIQPLKVFYAGVYAQDEWGVTKDLRLTLGLRLDVPWFGKTGYDNVNADQLTFRDEGGNSVQYKTDKLPDANILWSPRLGFNWDVTGNRGTQVRGGTGIFTGRPAYVWISNQIGNTGVLTGFAQLDNIPAGRPIGDPFSPTAGGRPFNPNPDRYKPTNVTGAPAASYELALTNPDFKFPQLWRSNIAVDHRLPFQLIGTVEFLYNRDVNGIYYINANLPAPQTRFSGVDNRPRYTSNRIHSHVANTIVLKNQNVGRSWSISGSLEKPFSDGWFAKVAYNYGKSKNTIDPGSIAFGSWNNNQHPGDPNNPGLGFSLNSPGHRIFATASYRKEYFKFGATTISLFWEGVTIGNYSYTFSGDLNGDGGTSNDLIYIPRDKSEMNFQQFTVSGGPTFTPQQQADAFEAYIQQDPYLSKHRGEYAERGGAFLPMVFRADLSVVQEVFTDLLGKRNSLAFRVDFLNIGNLINKNWGVGQRPVGGLGVNNSYSILTVGSPVADTQGRAQYRLRTVGTGASAKLIDKTFEPTAGLSDVFSIQLSVRYSFN